MKKQIITISNIDTKEYFFTTNHCQDHNLGNSWVSCTYTIPMYVEPRKSVPDGIIKDKADLVSVFYDDMIEISNPDSKFKI